MSKIQIGVTRFTEDSWLENKEWRETHNYTGCIYGVDREISPKVVYGSKIFVIEMNNTTNMIMGVGLIHYINRDDWRRKIYKNGNYNRFCYRGKRRRSREELLKKDAEIVKQLEEILFKGSRHFKRGHGIYIIPAKRFGCIYKEKRRKKTQCSKCGMVGHNSRSCSLKKRVVAIHTPTSKRMCKICGKLDKGHICTNTKIDFQKIKKIMLFFANLFDKF